MFKWIEANDVTLGWLLALSLVMFVAALILVPWVIVRLPSDYFAPPKRDRSRYQWRRPVLKTSWRVGKNVAGALLVLVGLPMLPLPGQGLLTILIGVSLMDFPGKYRLERRIVRCRPVLKAVNALRARSGRPPLQFAERPGQATPQRSSKPP
jgi:hypothetical protein